MADTFTLEFAYKRSVGSTIGAYLTGLADERIVGTRTASGRVIVPPLEYDPETGESTSGVVDVADVGTIEHCAWVAEPMEQHPLDEPFAWALIRLDGADTALVHAVAGDRSQIVAGARVRARWRAEREGHPLDIECFEIDDAS